MIRIFFLSLKNAISSCRVVLNNEMHLYIAKMTYGNFKSGVESMGIFLFGRFHTGKMTYRSRVYGKPHILKTF